MKWIFYVIVFIYLSYKAVYGIKQIHKETRDIEIVPIDYGVDKNYFEAGGRQSLTCKGTSKNQKIEWIDPTGKIVQKVTTNRVFTQDSFVTRNRLPASVLTFTQVFDKDTGIWTCRSGDITKDVPLCIIQSSEFVDTPTEITVERGRSITLTCQARGDPEPRLSWYRNSEVITDQNMDSKYHVMTKYNSQGFESLLTITGLEPEDNGEYICDAIQENPNLDDCSATTTFNITVKVLYAPIIVDENVTYVAGMENESVDLDCTTDGNPEVTYKWFVEVGDLENSESSKISVQHADNKAILRLVANSSTFGHEYRCQASNTYGHVSRVFVVMKLENPKNPNRIHLENATDDSLKLSLHWDDELYFAVDEVSIQYLNLIRNVYIPKEKDWAMGRAITVKPDSNDVTSQGVMVTLPGLDEETIYWVRFQTRNRAGDSPWSTPILLSTVRKSEQLEEAEEGADEDDKDGKGGTEKPTTEAQVSNGTFYGIFFAGGIVIVAVGFMFAMRVV